MKFYFILLFIPFLLFSQQNDSLQEISEFGLNPGNLKFYIHPNQALNEKSVPLVIVLHGCTQNAKAAAELSGWNKLADINNFIVIYPQQKFINNTNLCFNWFLNHDINKDKGECESIFEMINYTKSKFNIDTSKIFITGFSAGAAMSLVMTAVHPETFNSAAIFAGGAYKSATNPIDAISVMLGNKQFNSADLAYLVKKQNKSYSQSYPKLIVYHAKNDPVVNYENSNLIIKQWTELYKSDTIPESIETDYKNIKTLTKETFNNQSGEIFLTRYSIDKIGHRLLVSPGESNNKGGKTGLFGIDLGYHSTYETAKQFGIILK